MRWRCLARRICAGEEGDGVRVELEEGDTSVGSELLVLDELEFCVLDGGFLVSADTWAVTLQPEGMA